MECIKQIHGILLITDLILLMQYFRLHATQEPCSLFKHIALNVNLYPTSNQKG